MDSFAAIDFETANGNASSVCSVGVVIVRKGKIVDRIYRLIRPTPNYYSEANVRVHGLQRCDTDSAARFPEVWSEIAEKVAGLPFVAHFSRFDEGCLRAVMREYDMEWPEYVFYCTCTQSRKMLGKVLPNHKLPTVASYLGYNLREHHHALSDAEACAHIALCLFTTSDEKRKIEES